MVVFRNGERALQVLPPLLGVVAEARLNLVIHHMHAGEIEEAYAQQHRQAGAGRRGERWAGGIIEA